MTQSPEPIPGIVGELKPCPFCGAKAEIEDGRNDRPWVVECPNRDCHAQPFMDHADSRLEAIAAWNARTADQHIERIAAERDRQYDKNVSLIARLAASEDRIERLTGALRGLEQANEELAAQRSVRTYHSIIQDGAEDLLLALDNARQKARAALSLIKEQGRG